MRIVHCLRAPVGGLFRHVLDLASAQATLGHDVGIIADRVTGNVLTEAQFAAIAPILTLGIARVSMPRLLGPGDVISYRAVRSHIAPLDLDVLHGHGAKGGAYARLAGRSLRARGTGLRVFYTPHGGTLHYPANSLEGRFYIALERALDHMTDAIIFESAFAARMYADRIGPGLAIRRLVHNGLRRDDFTPLAPAPNAADILFVGELRDLKGVDVLLHAIAGLRAGRVPDLTAVIVGDGPDRTHLEALSRSLNLASSVIFAGALPAAQAFTLGRILAVPSRKESLPYIVLEAAARGVPLVASNVGGIPEIVAGTDTALVRADDADALADTLARLIEYPEMARSRARRLRTAVAGRFTVERMAAAVLAVYRNAPLPEPPYGPARVRVKTILATSRPRGAPSAV